MNVRKAPQGVARRELGQQAECGTWSRLARHLPRAAVVIQSNAFTCGLVQAEPLGGVGWPCLHQLTAGWESPQDGLSHVAEWLLEKKGGFLREEEIHLWARVVREQLEHLAVPRCQLPCCVHGPCSLFLYKNGTQLPSLGGPAQCQTDQSVSCLCERTCYRCKAQWSPWGVPSS